MPKQKVEKKCEMCYGFGWWPMGSLTPIGEMDSREWPSDKIIKCPWCGAGQNDEDPRYVYLKEQMEKMKENKK